MADVCRHMDMESFLAGETIYHQGAPADKLYIILSGYCDVKLRYKIDLTQGETEIREKSIKSFSAGQYFGELALDSSEPRDHTVVASIDSDLVVIQKHLFISILNEAKDEDRKEVATRGKEGIRCYKVYFLPSLMSTYHSLLYLSV
jgi:CRP-like cAMP-binding protein